MCQNIGEKEINLALREVRFNSDVSTFHKVHKNWSSQTDPVLLRQWGYRTHTCIA